MEGQRLNATDERRTEALDKPLRNDPRKIRSPIVAITPMTIFASVSIGGFAACLDAQLDQPNVVFQ